MVSDLSQATLLLLFLLRVSERHGIRQEEASALRATPLHHTERSAYLPRFVPGSHADGTERRRDARSTAS